MLDIGFSEIALIFVLALVVLGPEKLPRVTAQVGRWIGRARGMARQFREQLEEEVNLEETRKAKPPVVTQTPPPSATPLPTTPAAEASRTSEVAEPVPPSAPEAVSPLPSAPEAVSPPLSAVEAASVPPAESAQQIVYPDTYSHAHPTDSLGRAVEAPTNEPAAVDSGQQDWVGGVTATDKPAQTPTAPAYAPSHERGT